MACPDDLKIRAGQTRGAVKNKRRAAGHKGGTALPAPRGSGTDTVKKAFQVLLPAMKAGLVLTAADACAIAALPKGLDAPLKRDRRREYMAVYGSYRKFEGGSNGSCNSHFHVDYKLRFLCVSTALITAPSKNSLVTGKSVVKLKAITLVAR